MDSEIRVSTRMDALGSEKKEQFNQKKKKIVTKMERPKLKENVRQDIIELGKRFADSNDIHYPAYGRRKPN